MLMLTARRVQNGWSKSELARRARMTASDVGRIEAKRLVPYESQLRKLARALGLSVREADSLMVEVDDAELRQ